MANIKVKVPACYERSSVILTGKHTRLHAMGCISVHPSILRGSASPTLRGIESLTNILGNKQMFLGYIGSSDIDALGRDWRQVGIDIKRSMRSNRK